MWLKWIFLGWVAYVGIYWIWIGLSKLFKILAKPLVDEAITQYKNTKSSELHLLDVKVKQREDELSQLESNILQIQSEIDAYPNTIEYKRKKELESRKKELESQITYYQNQLVEIKEKSVEAFDDIMINLFNSSESKVFQYLHSRYMYYNEPRFNINRIMETRIEKELRQEVVLEISGRMNEVKNKLDILRKNIINNIPEAIENTAEFYADIKARIFDYYGNFLLSKSHPAHDTAAYIKTEAKREIRDVTKKWKEALYNYEYLKAQIEEKISDDVDFEEIETSIDEEKDSEDKWLSKEEYARLSSIERSALALQRYIQRPKSKRQIGRDYEEFIAYLFRTQNGFARCDIEMYGQLKGFDDLGRDIVVKNRDKLYIVQCKRWSRERCIRENAIMQLFGTVCEYCLEHRIDPMEALNKNVYAIFCATTQLSDTAQRFAQILGIKFYQVEQGEYPRIKCNINNTTGEKIYHLPFDQQYNNIKIELNKGEYMATTVYDAEAKGFRRAKKHNYN